MNRDATWGFGLFILTCSKEEDAKTDFSTWSDSMGAVEKQGKVCCLNSLKQLVLTKDCKLLEIVQNEKGQAQRWGEFELTSYDEVQKFAWKITQCYQAEMSSSDASCTLIVLTEKRKPLN